MSGMSGACRIGYRALSESEIVLLNRPLAKLLAKRRKDAGFTQVQFAKRVGYSQQMISKIECKSNAVILVRDLAIYADALDFIVDIRIAREDG